MKLRPNRPIERAGVNAAQALFESQNWVFQPVNLENDYGKDAYVDVPNGVEVTGICAALQIKSGASFRRANGYAIPVEGHERVWKDSPLPIMGIVHDPDNDQLYWCDISAFLREHPETLPATIPVSPANVLDATTLKRKFADQVRRTAILSPMAVSLLDLCSDSIDLQVAAILRAYGTGGVDARPLILVRRLITSFKGPALEAAIDMLRFAVNGGGYFAPQERWSDASRSALTATLRSWGDAEILHLLSLDWEEWQKGGVGREAYLLLRQDPRLKSKLFRVIELAIVAGNEAAAWAALFLRVHLAGDKGSAVYDRIVDYLPKVRTLHLIGDLESSLGNLGFVSMD